MNAKLSVMFPYPAGFPSTGRPRRQGRPRTARSPRLTTLAPNLTARLRSVSGEVIGDKNSLPYGFCITSIVGWVKDIVVWIYWHWRQYPSGCRTGCDRSQRSSRPKQSRWPKGNIAGPTPNQSAANGKDVEKKATPPPWPSTYNLLSGVALFVIAIVASHHFKTRKTAEQLRAQYGECFVYAPLSV